MLTLMTKGTPPKKETKYGYLVFDKDRFHIVHWWSSSEIYIHSGKRQAGAFLDTDGFEIDNISDWMVLKGE